MTAAAMLARHARAAVAIAALLVAGCVTAPIKVGESHLNWVIVTYRPVKGDPCRINLVGTGYIDYIEGASPLVADDFSTDVSNARWQDKYQERLGLQPSEVRTWIQRLVDAGLGQKLGKIPKERQGTTDVVFVRGNIDFKKMACVTDDEKMVAVVRSLIRSVKSNGGRP